MEENERIVDGYEFVTPADAEIAREELKKIAYIEAHMDGGNPENVLTIYEKMIANRLFVTPPGLYFLKGVQAYLYEAPEIDNARIRALPLSHNYSPAVRREQEAKLKAAAALKEEASRRRPPVSIGLNIVLAIAVIAMFVIAMTSDNPNILNYERAIQNRYAEWGQELTEREQAVRQKERELGIE